MENLYLKIIQRVKEHAPELTYVDEDYGQLYDEKNSYPITFPCLLVGDVETDWTNQTPASQTGVGTFRTMLVIDCYDDTHLGSGQEEKIVERAALDAKIYKALQGYRWTPDRSVGYIKRIKSRHYSVRGAIKVYETTWAYNVVDETAKG